MRRKERQIENRADIDAFINRSPVCRLGMVDDDMPYIVPMSFGYDGHAFYFHSALKGRKIDVLKRNPRVCFELDESGDLIRGEKACSWSVLFRSVIGTGRAEFIEDDSEKRRALDVLMNHYSEEAPKEFAYSDKALKAVCIFRVVIETITGKEKAE